MKKAYITYKEWWIDWYYSDGFKPGAEGAFEQHIEDIGLYGLMETLVVWEDLLN